MIKRMLRHCFAMLGAIMLSGCLSTEQYPCHGSFRIEPSQEINGHEKAIIEAAKRWNNWLGYTHFTITDNGTCPIRLDPNLEDQAFYGFKDGEAWINVKPALLKKKDEFITRVIMHEFGHSEGLAHVKGKAIMSIDDKDDPDAKGILTDLDRAECERVDFCKK
jgi:hypothetical protein